MFLAQRLTLSIMYKMQDIITISSCCPDPGWTSKAGEMASPTSKDVSKVGHHPQHLANLQCNGKRIWARLYKNSEIIIEHILRWFRGKVILCFVRIGSVLRFFSAKKIILFLEYFILIHQIIGNKLYTHFNRFFLIQ